MKKILLLFGVVAFTSVSAQQNDFFDVEKHLQKKSKEKQSKKFPVLSIPKIKKFNFPKFDQENFYSHLLIGSTTYYLLPNGNKVYPLSQDHMPCIVPDMSQWNTMPNLAYNNLYNSLTKKTELRKIPNAWTKPPVLIPE